jgi:hypothetical protein
VSNPAKLPWWHDLIIVLFLVALGVVGVAALWGDRIRGWFGDDAEAPPAVEEPKIPGTST